MKPKIVTLDSPGKTRGDQQTSWEDDYRERLNPELVTKLLRKAVPVLGATGWKVTEVAPGFCETLLPLNAETTNQHGTHQAALISLSADYTGGIAFNTMLRGVPIAGVHPGESRDSASLWLANMDVKYIRPSTGHLIGRCKVAQHVASKVANRYSKGKRVLVTLPIEFFANDQLVATANMKYFAQPTSQLLAGPAETSTLLNAKAKASARMIAGVRARSYAKPNGNLRGGLRLDFAHADTAAGPHGLLLAEKMNRALPQLGEMVTARTAHIDAVTDRMDCLKQVVMLGAGLDMRAFRQSVEERNLKFFELDLPEMLRERERVVASIKGTHRADRTMVSVNFLKDDISSKLMSETSFDPLLPTLFIYEGCSMYFDEQTNVRLMKAVSAMMQHPESRMWTDLVNAEVIDGTVTEPSVQDFLGRMSELGESFTYGVSDPKALVEACGMEIETMTTTNEFFPTEDAHDASILDLYWFVTSGPKPNRS